MKEILKTTFTLVGAVVGAGFISGKELVRFYGGRAFLPFLFLTIGLFFVYFYFLLKAGIRYGSFNNFLKCKVKKFPRAVRSVFLLSSFVLIVAMLAGINALAPKFSPFVAVFAAVACFFIGKKGVCGVKNLNFILVPCIVGYIVFSLFSAENFTFAENPQNAGMDTFFCCLYVAMNAFLCTPVAVEAGGEIGSEKAAAISAAVSAIIIGGIATLILSAIAATAGAAERTLPLAFVLKNGKAFPFILFLGILTSLVSACFTVFEAMQTLPFSSKGKNAAKLIVLFAAFCFSLSGLDKIVNMVYPVIGAIGFLFLFAVIFDYQAFEKHHHKVHNARKGTKDNGSRHH